MHSLKKNHCFFRPIIIDAPFQSFLAIKYHLLSGGILPTIRGMRIVPQRPKKQIFLSKYGYFDVKRRQFYNLTSKYCVFGIIFDTSIHINLLKYWSKSHD